MNILGKAAVYMERHRARRELQRHARALASLSDHHLDDIGITRAQARQMNIAAFGWSGRLDGLWR